MTERSDPDAPPIAPSEPAPFEPAAVVEPAVAEPAAAEPFAVEPVVPVPPPRLGRWRRFRRALRVDRRTAAIFMRGALGLMILGFCLSAFLMQLTSRFRTKAVWNLHDFVNTNQLAARARTQMLLWLGAGALCGALVALVVQLWRWRRRPPVARAVRVLRTSRLFWPLMLPSLMWPLLVATDWDALARTGGIAFVALIGEVCVRASTTELLEGRLALARFFARVAARLGSAFARVRRLVKPATAVVVLGTLFYAVWMSWGTILQHRHFGTSAYDLGNYDTMFFNTLHGHPFRCPAVFPKGENWTMLSTHAELTMFALLPFYAIRPGSETLLIMQAVALALGAFPVYRFAARRLPRPAAAVLALAYLAYAPMHQANFYDVHFQPFAVLFTLWALDMLDARRPILFTLFFVLALGCREDVPIGFAVLGVYLLLVGRHTRAAILMMLTSVAYFVVIKFIVMPKFGSWWFSDMYRDLYPTGENTYGGVVKTLLSNPIYVWKTLVVPEKVVLISLVLVPLVFLPLRRRLLWMCLLPAVPFTVLTTGYGPTVQISFQYVLLFVPFIFLATAVALATYTATPQGRARLTGAMGGIAIGTFLVMRVWGAMPPGDKFKGGFRDIPEFAPLTQFEKQKAKDLAELAAKIPKDAPVAVSEMEHAHVSARLNALGLRNSGTDGADYVLYATDQGGADIAQNAVSTGQFETVEQRPSSRIALLRRKKP
jgi:uncharacterized membrane protein